MAISCGHWYFCRIKDLWNEFIDVKSLLKYVTDGPRKVNDECSRTVSTLFCNTILWSCFYIFLLYTFDHQVKTEEMPLVIKYVFVCWETWSKILLMTRFNQVVLFVTDESAELTLFKYCSRRPSCVRFLRRSPSFCELLLNLKKMRWVVRFRASIIYTSILVYYWFIPCNIVYSIDIATYLWLNTVISILNCVNKKLKT